MWVDQKVIQMRAGEVPQGEEASSTPLLTEREQQVLQGVFEGLANKEIGRRLGVTEGAVKACM